MALKTREARDPLEKALGHSSSFEAQKKHYKIGSSQRAAKKTSNSREKTLSEEVTSVSSSRKGKTSSLRKTKSRKDGIRESSRKDKGSTDSTSSTRKPKRSEQPKKVFREVEVDGKSHKRVSLRMSRKSGAFQKSSLDAVGTEMLVNDNPLFDEKNAVAAATAAARAVVMKNDQPEKGFSKSLKSARRSLSRLAIDWLSKSGKSREKTSQGTTDQHRQLTKDLIVIISAPCSSLEQLEEQLPLVSARGKVKNKATKSVLKAKLRLIRAGMDFLAENQDTLDRANPEKLCVLLHNLVLLLSEQKRYEEAEALCAQALAVMNCSSSKNRVPVTATSLHLWAGLLRAQGKDEDVAALFLDYMQGK